MKGSYLRFIDLCFTYVGA